MAGVDKQPGLSEVLPKVSAELDKDARAQKIMAKAGVLCIAVLLSGKPHKNELGKKLSYTNQFTRMLPRLYSALRNARMDFVDETRQLVSLGPQRYYQRTTQSLVALQGEFFK